MSEDMVAVEIGVLAFELARRSVWGARDHATPGTLTDVHADDEVIEFASAYARYYQRHKHARSSVPRSVSGVGRFGSHRGGGDDV